MNSQNLSTIVLVSVLFVILAIVGGVLAASGSPIAAALMIVPMFLGGMCLMKEKVWYLWFLLPPVFTLTPYGEFGRLAVCCVTVPFFIWQVLLRRTSLIWNKAVLLDIFILLMFVHVAIVFILHPFALGVSGLQDYYGGKGYVLFFQALVVYACVSSLKSDSNTIGKLLNWVVWITLFCILISTVRGFLNPELMADMEEGGGLSSSVEGGRFGAFLGISSMVLCLLIINYSIKDFFKKPWLVLIALAACYGIMISGFRNAFAKVCFLFLVVSILHKRWIASIVLPAAGLLILVGLSETKMLREMPYGIQRVCSVVPFLDVESHIRINAEASSEWRYEMWGWAMDDRERFIKDRMWGDGFAREIHHLKVQVYQNTFGLSKGGSMGQENFAWEGQWHSGPIDTVHKLGYVGLGLYVIIAVVGIVYAWKVSVIYRNHRYRLGILYLSTNLIIEPVFFLFFFGVCTGIAGFIMNLCIVKLLYRCAVREGLYEPISVRKEYVPLMIRLKENGRPLKGSPDVLS